MRRGEVIMEKGLYSLDNNVLQERISRLEKLVDKETDPVALKTLQLELERRAYETFSVK